MQWSAAIFMSGMKSRNQFYPAVVLQLVLAMVQTRSTSYGFYPVFTVLAGGL